MGKIDQRFKDKQRNYGFKLDNVGARGLTTNESLQAGLKLIQSGLEKYEGKFKGYYDGLCNRSACLSPNDVHYYNIGSYAFYCPDCARELNQSNNGEPYVTFKTAEEAATLYVMAKKIDYIQALRQR